MSPTVGFTAGGAARSRVPWWLVVLAAAFLGYHALLLHSDLSRPEPAGFVFGIHGSEMVVLDVAPGSQAAGAGLLVGDRLLTASGNPIRSRLDWLSIEMNLRSGQPLELEVLRGGVRERATLTPNRVPWPYWTTAAGATLLSARLVQLVTLLLALVVAVRRPYDRLARMGAWALATIGVYSIVWPDQIAATWRALPNVVGVALWMPFVSSLAIAPILFTFFATFPRPIIRSSWAWGAVWAPMAPVLLLQLHFARRVVYQPEQTLGFLDWTLVNVVVTAGYTIAALTTLVLGYRRLTDLTERRRVRVLLVGSVVGLLSALPVAAGYWWQSETSPGSSMFASPMIAVGSMLALALPASFAYAILRHRLFDIRLIVRLGVQYALARRVLISVVPGTAVVLLIDLWVNRQIPFGEILRARGWLYAGLGALAIVARVRRDVWLDTLDRRFFRERLNAQRLLRGISREVREATDLETVAPRVVSQIDAALHPEFSALLVRHSGEPAYHTVAAARGARDLERLRSECKVLGLLQWLRKPIQFTPDDRAWLLRHLPREEIEALHRARVELLVPVQAGAGGTDALFALGPKRSEEPYTSEDEDLLMAIGDSLALLLARSPAPASTQHAFEECPACGACYEFGTGRCAHDDAELAVAPLPRLLGGRYRLDRRVGRGGMGTVYAARDTALERDVAAKVLREDIVGPAAAERFQSEARLGAALAHPNVVTVHDIGVTATGRAFFIMELLEGVTLREELGGAGRLALPRVLHILRGVSAAVDAAHARQMIHRDLKPENIFLSRSGGTEIPKVLDFGLAKALEASGGVVLTTPGLVAGTPQYMAPEHLSGDDPSPDWDLWALAVMAFEMITGVLPGAGASGPPRHVDMLPPALRQVFLRALSTNPLDRPTSAQEFSDALDRELVCDGLPS